ncbi:MAG: HD domain-containing protein [Elusimicrobiales bacterium]|nr:HD domain-containing protein [Elusimicrobiales bacterium]
MKSTPLTGEDYGRVAAWFKSYVDGFRDGGGTLPGPLEFKRVHSARVAENAAQIAAGLELGEGECALARAAGLLHDVGRFRQYSWHASFIDARSLDHGLEGRRVLEEKAAGLFPDAALFRRLLCATEFHNRRPDALPKDLPPADNSLLLLVRDADKVDIMETLLGSAESGNFGGLQDTIPDIKLEGGLTPGVAEAAARGETLSLKNLHTLADILVMVAGWFHDLNYAPARRVAAERGFLPRLRRRLPANPVLDTLFADLARTAASPGARYIEI